LCIVVVLNILLLVFAGYVRRVNHEQLVTVQIAAGSENLAFLQDSQVLAEFANRGLSVEVTGFGSGTLANELSPKGYDAFLLSSQVFADETDDRLGQFTEYQPFTTPLMVFTWRRLIPLLRHLRIVNNAGQFDLGEYLKVASSGVRWDQIPGNTFYPNESNVLLEITDPRKSDSGAMFVAAASYVLNGDQMVSTNSQVRTVAPEIAGILGKLGEMPPTTNFVFQDYLRDGMNGMPLALGYASEAASPLPAGAVGLPLDFTVNCVHTAIPFDSSGRMFGQLLTSDQVLQNLEQKFGFESGTGTQDPNSNFAISAPTAHFLKDLVDEVTPQS
jgi:hypothetical protein